MDGIVGAYESFFEWSAGRSESLLMGEKVENDISCSCTIGKVVSFKLERDGIPRRAKVEYQNSGESFTQNQITNKAARSLVKSFSEEESTWKKVEKLIKTIKDNKIDVNLVKSNQITLENTRKRLKSNSEPRSKIVPWLDEKLTCKESCCISHFNMCLRDLKEIVHKKCDFQFKDLYPEPKQTEFADVLDRSWDTVGGDERVQLRLPRAGGVLAVINKFLEIQ